MKTIKSENGKPDARKVGTITNIKEVYVTEDCSSILALKIEYSMNHDGHMIYGEQFFLNSDLLAYLPEMEEQRDLTLKTVTKEESFKMTDQEAIKMLKSKMDGNTDTSYEWTECVCIAINAIAERMAREKHE